MVIFHSFLYVYQAGYLPVELNRQRFSKCRRRTQSCARNSVMRKALAVAKPSKDWHCKTADPAAVVCDE
jgi:hypothetical protein